MFQDSQTIGGSFFSLDLKVGIIGLILGICTNSTLRSYSTKLTTSHLLSNYIYEKTDSVYSFDDPGILFGRE